MTTPDLPRNTILEGDALATLRGLPSRSVQTVITSPPYYNLRDYGVEGQIGLEASLDEYLAKMLAVFDEVFRVLRPDGTCWINIGDSYTGGIGWKHGDNSYSTLGPNRDGLTPQNAAFQAPRAKQKTIPHGLKPKDLMLVPFRLVLALQAAGWWVRSDIIWSKPNCLSGGTMLYARTQKGEMPAMLKDLVRLRPETVQLWNGERWTQVLAWQENPRPDNPIEIKLRNGQRIGCTAEHLWPTQRGIVCADELRIGDVIQVTTLPEPSEPRMPSGLDDSDIGWFVGMYIAEGSRDHSSIRIDGQQRVIERFTHLCHIAEAYDGTCRMHHTSSNGATITLYGPVLRGILDTYMVGDGAKDKHLSSRAWKRSNAFLRGVLDGYLEGDGHYDALNNRWRLGFTRNYAWESDLRTICARVGAHMRLRLSTVRYEGRDVPIFRGEIRFAKSAYHTAKNGGEVLHIGRSRARKFWDVTVADEPHLFALASGVLTHNCMPESVTDRPTTAHEHIFLLTRSERYYYDADAIREPLQPKTFTTYGTRHRPQGNDALGNVKSDNWGRTVAVRHPKLTEDGALAGANKRTVWTISSEAFPESHYATFPTALITPMVLAGSSPYACEHCSAPWVRVVARERFPGRDTRTPGTHTPTGNGKLSGRKTQEWLDAHPPVTTGWRPSCRCTNNTGAGRCVILDPFMGSGTTGVVAAQYGRDYLGIELSAEYASMARRRIAEEGRPVALKRKQREGMRKAGVQQASLLDTTADTSVSA